MKPTSKINVCRFFLFHFSLFIHNLPVLRTRLKPEITLPALILFHTYEVNHLPVCLVHLLAVEIAQVFLHARTQEVIVAHAEPLQPQERIVTFTTPRCNDNVMIVTSDGYSKRVKSSDLNGTTQNLKGMPIVKLHDAAEVVSIQCCEDYECLALTTTKKQLLLSIEDIPVLTKASPGRKAMKLAAEDRVEFACLTTKENKTCGKMGSVGKNIS